MSIIYYSVFATKLGWAGIACNQTKIKAIILPNAPPFGRGSPSGGSKEYIIKRLKQNYPCLRPADRQAGGKRNPTGLEKIIKSLQRYLSGEKESLSFPVDLSNHTSFERQVYQALKKVRYGKVRTYGWLARRVGNPSSARAVGNTLAKNPAPLVIPCHRIILNNGKIGNFSAKSGPALKAKLLAMEGKQKW